MRPEGLLEGHGDGAVLGQRLEDALGVRGLLDRRHHCEALRHLVAVRGRITAEEVLTAEIDARVDDLPTHLGRRLLAPRGFAVGHGEHDPAAEGLGVKVEGLAAVALEVHVGSGLHDLTPY